MHKPTKYALFICESPIFPLFRSHMDRMESAGALQRISEPVEIARAIKLSDVFPDDRGIRAATERLLLKAGYTAVRAEVRNDQKLARLLPPQMQEKYKLTCLTYEG